MSPRFEPADEERTVRLLAAIREEQLGERPAIQPDVPPLARGLIPA